MKKTIRGNGWSLVCMILISCVTQVATLMKSSIVAGSFGVGDAMDAYNFANSILSFVFGIIASGVPTIIIPAYVKEKDRKGIDGFLTILYGFLLVLIALVILLRYQIVYTFTDRSQMFANIACDALLALSFAQYLSSITGITTAYFQNKNKPNIPKLVNLASQLVVLVMLVLWKGLNIYDYIFVISLGIGINFVVDTLVAVQQGWRYRPRLNVRNPVTLELLGCLWPILCSSSVYKLSLLVDSMIATNLDAGKLTILNYANQIVSMINSLIIGNILIYVYPRLIRQVKAGEGQGYFWRQAILFHMIICLLIAGFFAVGQEGVALLFQRGLFDASATQQVFYGAMIYIFGQQFNIVRDMLYRYFYCIGDTKTPAKNSVLVSVVNITVSVLLVFIMGLYGIILGTVIASMVSLVSILLRFRKHVGLPEDIRRTLFIFGKNALAMVCTALVVAITKQLLPLESLLGSILLFGAETVAVYAGIIWLTNRDVLKGIRE